MLRFPAWWYGKGLLRAARYTWGFVAHYARSLGVMVWMVNIFTPMFGRYDWQSRIISVFMRFVNIVARGVAVCIVAVCALVVFAAYVLLPAIAVVFALYHATSFLGV